MGGVHWTHTTLHEAHSPPPHPTARGTSHLLALRAWAHHHLSDSSLAQRADLLELDCQLTRDGVVVVSHDQNLSRQSGLNRDVGSLDFEVSGPLPVPPAQSRHLLPSVPPVNAVSTLPQDLPLYKEELEVYFSPGENKG